MGNQHSRKRDTCRQHIWQKPYGEERHYSHNYRRQCDLEGTEVPYDRGGKSGRNALSYQRCCNDGPYINQMFGDIIIHQQERSIESEYQDLSEDCLHCRNQSVYKKKKQEKSRKYLENRRIGRLSRCRQQIHTSLDSSSESDCPKVHVAKQGDCTQYSYSRTANTSDQNRVDTVKDACELDISSDSSYAFSRLNNYENIGSFEGHKNLNVGSNSYNPARKMNNRKQKPGQRGMSHESKIGHRKIPNWSKENSDVQKRNVVNGVNRESNGCRQDLNKSESYREPVQIDGSIQQVDTHDSEHSKYSRERTDILLTSKSNCKEPNRSSLSRIADTNTTKENKEVMKKTCRSICDSSSITSNTTVDEADDTEHFRNASPKLSTTSNIARFESQANVVSVMSNTDNAKSNINQDTLNPDQRGLYSELENRSEELADSFETYSSHTEGETTRKCENSDFKDEKVKPCKRLLSESVFDDESDNGETCRKLDLRCESDIEEIVYLKLPGPSFEHDTTELKRSFTTPLLMDIQQVPSSGYPFITSNTDFQGNLTHDSLPDDSEECSDALSDTLKSQEFSMKSFSESSNQVDKLREHDKLNSSQDKPCADIKDDMHRSMNSDFLSVPAEITTVSQPLVENMEEDSSQEKSCVEDTRNDSDILYARTNQITPTCTNSSTVVEKDIYNEINSDRKMMPLEGSLVDGLRSSTKHYSNSGNKAQNDTCYAKDLGTRGNMRYENSESESDSLIANGSEELAPRKNTYSARKRSLSFPGNAATSHCAPSEKSRRRNLSESCESGYHSCTSNEGLLDCTSERRENISITSESHPNTIINSKMSDCNTECIEIETSETMEDSKTIKDLNYLCRSLMQLGGKDCKKNHRCSKCPVFEKEKLYYIPINSYNCPNVMSLIIDRLDEGNIRLLKVSEDGLLQEFSLNYLTETQSSETDHGIEDETDLASTRQSTSKEYPDKNRDCDEAYSEDESCESGLEESSNNANGKMAFSQNKKGLDNVAFVSFSKETIHGKKESIVRKQRSFSEALIDYPYTQHTTSSVCDAYMFTELQEFNGFSKLSTKTQILCNATASYACKASSESDLFNLKLKPDEQHPKIMLNRQYENVETESRLMSDIEKATDHDSTISSRKEQSPSNCNESDVQLEVHGQFSKTVSPTPNGSLKMRKRLRKKRRNPPKAETGSLYYQQSVIQTSSGSSSNSYKKSNITHGKRKGQRSWNQSYSRHQRSRKLRSEISWGFTDSGICISGNSKCSSVQFMIANYPSLNKLKSSKGKGVAERLLRKISPIITKQKKTTANLYRKIVKRFCERRGRRVAKSVVRDLFARPRTDLEVGVLESYFQRMNNGQPPSTHERMQYEWLRLATFGNYTGNGNALALARNGFYHDHNEGPAATRCYLCDARHANWEMFDDVNVEHRRQSPNCPFHENRGQESLNISITYGDNEGGASAQARTSAPTVTSANTTVTTSSTASSSAAAVSEAMRSLQVGQASSSGGESGFSQQPTEDPESRDRSLLALSQPRTQRALGRTGQSYSTIIAPRRNNVATGARSNVGVDPAGSGSVTSSTSSQLPGIRPSSILGGPVGAGAFAGLNTTGQNTSALTAVTRATEGSQQSNAPSPSTEAAAGTRQTNPAPGAGGRTDPTITVVVDNPKHPDYVNIDSRVGSYQGWPDYLDQTPRQMSEAGFFFVGVADFTRCFCCGGGLRNWEPGDDPMLEHTRWFPRCEYVNKLKGERYVAAVQRRHQEHMADQQRQQIEIAQRRDENRNPPDPMTTEAAAVMREMGYSAERTREAILAVRRQTGLSVVTTQQVLTWLLDDEERRLTGNSSNTELGIRPPPTSTSVASSIVNTSTPSSVVYTGTSIPSSIVYTGTSIGTSIVNTTSSISAATSIVSAGTTTSTVSSTSTSATAEVQQSSTSASGTSEGSSSGTGNQQTGSGNSTSSNSASGSSVEKQSGASAGDSDESKSTAKEDAASSEPTTKATKKKNAKKKAKNKTGAKSETAGATGGDLDARSLKAENEKLREMQTCKICMERAVNTTLLPCGHLVCCDTCASRLQRCPICRTRIKGTVKTFMS